MFPSGRFGLPLTIQHSPTNRDRTTNVGTNVPSHSFDNRENAAKTPVIKLADLHHIMNQVNMSEEVREQIQLGVQALQTSPAQLIQSHDLSMRSRNTSNSSRSSRSSLVEDRSIVGSIEFISSFSPRPQASVVTNREDDNEKEKDDESSNQTDPIEHFKQLKIPATPKKEIHFKKIKQENLQFLGRGSQATVYRPNIPSASNNEPEIKSVIKVFNKSSDFEKELSFGRRTTGMSHVLSPLAANRNQGVGGALQFQKMDKNSKQFFHSARQYLINEQISPDAFLNLVANGISECALGLASLHAKNIVHRDIKPDNILINEEGQIFVADLGIATTAKQVIQDSGTRGYMAPEAYLTKEANAKLDSYSLGQTLFHFITGTTVTDNLEKLCPFDLNNPATYTYSDTQIRDALIKKMPQPLHSIKSVRLKACQDVLIGLLCPVPENRFSIDKALDMDFFKQLPKKNTIYASIKLILQHNDSNTTMETDTTSSIT